MATVIDELVIRLNLDPKQFDQATQQSIKQLKQFEQDARQSGGAVEDSAKKMADGFEKVTKELLTLGGAFLGVNSLKNLAVQTTTAAANLGTLSTAVNTNAEALNRWQNAARHVGIGAEQSGAAIAGLITKLQQFQAHQIGPEGLGLRAMQALTNNGITQADLKPENVETLLFKLAAGARANPKNAAGLMAEIPGAGALLPLLQRTDLDALLAKSQTIFVDQVKAAQDIRDIFVDITVRLERKINSMLPEGRDRVRGVLKGINQIERGNYLEGLGNIDRSLGSTPNAPSMFDWRPRLPPTRADAGQFNPATAALADFLKENVPGFQRITAADDAYHQGRGGHGAGLALDFTIAGGEREHAIAAARLGRIPGLKAINEFAPGSSPGWTAPHLHVQFRDPTAAADFMRAQGNGAGGTKTITNHITVNTQPGADAHAIGAAVGAAVNAPEAMGGAH